MLKNACDGLIFMHKDYSDQSDHAGSSVRTTLSSLVGESLAKDTFYCDALSIVERNGLGKVWVIGGTVYRTLAQLLYARPRKSADFDFLVEDITDAIQLPDEWIVGKNRFGNPRWSGWDMSIDLVPLANIHSIKRRGLACTIENYLTGVPFTVQSVAYDIQTRQLLGEIGIKAMMSATIAVNNMEEAKQAAILNETTVLALLKAKAKELGFFPVIPSGL
jgi:hypothetical protein